MQLLPVSNNRIMSNDVLASRKALPWCFLHGILENMSHDYFDTPRVGASYGVRRNVWGRKCCYGLEVFINFRSGQ